jgi:hypothetical protein
MITTGPSLIARAASRALAGRCPCSRRFTRMFAEHRSSGAGSGDTPSAPRSLFVRCNHLARCNGCPKQPSRLF